MEELKCPECGSDVDYKRIPETGGDWRGIYCSMNKDPLCNWKHRSAFQDLECAKEYAERCWYTQEIRHLKSLLASAIAIIKADVCGNCTMENACKDGYECGIAEFLAKESE